MPDAISPQRILDTGFGFWPSKVLLTAVGLELFTKLGTRAMTADELGRALALHPRGTYDFFDALLAVLAGRRHPRLACLSYGLPVVEPIARRWIEKDGMAGRVKTAAGAFHAAPLPKADVVTMGMILHHWSLEKKRHFVARAYDALP